MPLIRMDDPAPCRSPRVSNVSSMPGQNWQNGLGGAGSTVPIYVTSTDLQLRWRPLHPPPLLNRKTMTRDIKDLIFALDIGTSKVVAGVAEILPEGRFRSEERRVGKEWVSTCRTRVGM